MHGGCTRVGHFRSTGFSFFGSDNDYTVPGACTIDGCGAGIFQHFDGFDVVRVDGSQDVVRAAGIVFTCLDGIVRSRIYRESVDNHQRVVTCVDRGCTANTEVRAAARLCADHIYLKSGCFTCQGMTDSGYSTYRSIVHFDGSHGSGQVFFLHCAISHYYDFFQYFRIFAQGDSHQLACLRFQHLSFVADVGYLELCLCRTDIQGEVTVYIGHGSVGRSFFYHAGSDNRFSAGIKHFTTDFYGGILAHGLYAFGGKDDFLVQHGVSHIGAGKYFFQHFEHISLMGGDRHAAVQVYVFVVEKEIKSCFRLDLFQYTFDGLVVGVDTDFGFLRIRFCRMSETQRAGEK